MPGTRRKVPSPGRAAEAGRGFQPCPGAWGWLRGGDISSLIAPLLSVLIKVSCEKTNVTNVFAGNEVRRERRLESCDSAIGGGGRGSPRGHKPSRAHAGRAWG